MISFDEARSQLLQRIQPVADREWVSLDQALGRVLAAPAIATAPVPNHDNSGMDGFAVRFDDLSASEETELVVVADLPAGKYRAEPLLSGQAVRIMTGAPIPPECDCIVIQEVVRREGARLFVPPGQKRAQNIRLAGEDIRAGEEALPAGRRLTPPDIGQLASLGLPRVEVLRRIKVAVLSTGDEVIPVGETLAPGQVHDSNRAQLKAALTKLGVEVVDLGRVGDDAELLAAALRRGGEADALVTSGGVSVGDFDLVKQVIRELGEIHFWKVAMKPGKPQAYGRLGRAEFFGLPGNPVSSLAVFLLLVRPALLRLMGAAPEPDQAFQVPFRGRHVKKHDRMDFLRGILQSDGQNTWVETTGPQGSGILSSFTRANVFIVLPERPMELRDGDLVTVRWFRYE